MLALVIVAGTDSMAEGLCDPLTVEFFVQDLGWTADRFARAGGTWGTLAEQRRAALALPKTA